MCEGRGRSLGTKAAPDPPASCPCVLNYACGRTRLEPMHEEDNEEHVEHAAEADADTEYI